MMRLKQLYRDKKATAMPLAIAVTLILLMLMCVLSEYYRLKIIAEGVRDGVQKAVVTVMNENYVNVYHGVREGYAGAYKPSGDGFRQSLDQGDVYQELDVLLGLDTEHVKYIGENKVEYRLSRLNVEMANPALAPGSSTNRLNADVSIRLEVPVRFGGKVLPSMKIDLKLKAGYTPQF